MYCYWNLQMRISFHVCVISRRIPNLLLYSELGISFLRNNTPTISIIICLGSSDYRCSHCIVIELCKIFCKLSTQIKLVVKMYRWLMVYSIPLQSVVHAGVGGQRLARWIIVLWTFLHFIFGQEESDTPPCVPRVPPRSALPYLLHSSLYEILIYLDIKQSIWRCRYVLETALRRRIY